jgi:hypothetical protein
MHASASSLSATTLWRSGWRPRQGLSTRVGLIALALLVLGSGASTRAAPPRKPPVASQKPLVAVLPPKALGLEKAEAVRLQAELIQAVKRGGRFRVLAAKAIQKVLARQPVGTPAALETLVPALRSRWALSGTLAGLGDDLSLDLKLLEGGTGAEVRRASAELPADPRDRAAALEELLVQLLEPQRWVGSLQLEVSEAGAQVWLDGAQVASSPLSAPLTGLAPGKHILMIRKEGQAEFSKFVVVRYDQVAQLKVDLDSATVVGLLYDKRPAEPRPRPAPSPAAPVVVAPAPASGLAWQGVTGWCLLSVGAASAVAGGLLAWHVEDLERQIADRPWTSADEAELADALAEGHRLRKVSTGLWAAGGGLVLVGGAFLLWELLGTDPDEPAGQGVVVAPAAGQGGAGLLLLGSF